MEGSTHGCLPGLSYLLVTLSTPFVSCSPDAERLDREIIFDAIGQSGFRGPLIGRNIWMRKGNFVFRGEIKRSLPGVNWDLELTVLKGRSYTHTSSCFKRPHASPLQSYKPPLLKRPRPYQYWDILVSYIYVPKKPAAVCPFTSKPRGIDGSSRKNTLQSGNRACSSVLAKCTRLFLPLAFGLRNDMYMWYGSTVDWRTYFSLSLFLLERRLQWLIRVCTWEPCSIKYDDQLTFDDHSRCLAS